MKLESQPISSFGLLTPQHKTLEKIDIQIGNLGQFQSYGRNYYEMSKKYHKNLTNSTIFVVISTKTLKLSLFYHLNYET